MAKTAKTRNIVRFLFEIGTLRKVARVHRQTLLEDDLSDSVASHSFRVAFIGWHIAKLEKVNPYKVVMMCLCHDIAEARSNDHNWVHKRYVKIYEDEISRDQLAPLPHGNELIVFVHEYQARETKESKISKDADLIDQLLLCREYSLRGNKEAQKWLDSKLQDKFNKNKFSCKTAHEFALEVKTCDPAAWWEKIWTSVNR